MEVTEFEAEAHADDDLKCLGCGCKICYCHGDTDYCSTCRKGMDTRDQYEMDYAQD